MKQKTPMQEFIEWLDKHGDNRLYGGRELTVHEIKNKARAMLEKEKEVIENIYNSGQVSDHHPFYGYMGDVYYEETFNTKEK